MASPTTIKRKKKKEERRKEKSRARYMNIGHAENFQPRMY